MFSLQKLIKIFELIFANHPAIESFRYGEVWEYDDSMQDDYLQVYLEFPLSIQGSPDLSNGGKPFEVWNFAFLVLDQISESISQNNEPFISPEIQEYKAVDKTNTVAGDIILAFRQINALSTFLQLQSYNVISLHRQYADKVYGVRVEMQLLVPSPIEPCESPVINLDFNSILDC